jgi:hypothetical protein
MFNNVILILKKPKKWIIAILLVIFLLILVIIITTLNGNSKLMHFYNQGNQMYMREDSAFLLRLIQAHDDRYNNVDIIDLHIPNDNSYLSDMIMKRFYNYSYVYDIFVNNYSLENKYNNSLYEVDKYKYYNLTSINDYHLLVSLYCDIFGIDDDDFNLFYSLKDGVGDYSDTHLFLLLLFLEKNNCYSNSYIEMVKNELVDNFISALDSEEVFSDLYAERVVFMYWGGYGNLVKEKWITLINDSQLPDLGWPDHRFSTEKGDAHATGFAILSQIYFNEGKDKQDFFFE